MSNLFNTIMTICGVSIVCCCTLFIGLVVVLVSRGRIMVLPALITFVGSFGFNIFTGIFGFLNRSRTRIYDEDFERGSSTLRSRAEKIKTQYDPFATPIDAPDDVFGAQSATKSRPSSDRFTMQPGTRIRPSNSGTGTGSSSTLPPPRANLPRKTTTTNIDSLRQRRNRPVDDDFDSLNPPRLRDRRGTQRRRNTNEYDDEVMGGVFDDEGDDGGLF